MKGNDTMPKAKENLINFSGMSKEEAVEAIKKVGFAKIQKDDIKNYLLEFEKGESREWLKEAYKEISKAKLVFVLDENGKKIETGKVDKDGKPKYKKKRVNKSDESGHKRYNHNTAKVLFFKRLGISTKEDKESHNNWEQDFDNYWN